MAIKDSGERREFSTGAVRDIQAGKGRCDLMPLDVVAGCYHSLDYHDVGQTFDMLNAFTESGDVIYLYRVFSTQEVFEAISDLFLEVSVHFEEGCAKYGENNWQKGIPVKCYIDSAVRHFLKFLRGDTDERHDRAFFWNIICAIWTCEHLPDLNNYSTKED